MKQAQLLCSANGVRGVRGLPSVSGLDGRALPGKSPVGTEPVRLTTICVAECVEHELFVSASENQLIAKERRD